MENKQFNRTVKLIWSGVFLALFALGSTGCTVHTAGMTLPNPHYPKNVPQFHARGLEYPFPNEASSLQDAEQRTQYGR